MRADGGEGAAQVNHSGGRRHASRAPVSLVDALFSRTQQRLLKLLFGQPERSFFTNELIALTGAGSGAVQRELTALTASGLLVTTRNGARRYFQANRTAAVFHELHSLVLKTIGAAEPLRAALQPLASQIRLAVLLRPVAAGVETPSDLDVWVVADALTLEQLYAATLQAEQMLARKVSVRLWTADEFRERQKQPGSWVTRDLAGQYVVLLGSAEGMAAGG